MRWSFMIARVGGIEVRIHFTFLLFLAWIGFEHYRQGGSAAAIEGVLFIVLLFSCVLLHEFGHALAARAFGIRTPDITLLPIGGVARLQRMPDKPWQELIVAVAGPAVNVVLALLLFLGVGPKVDFSDLEQLQSPQVGMLSRLATFNIWMMLFNLIPAFPMDGGRVLRSLLAMILSPARATQIAAWVGQALAFGFALFGILGPNPNFILILIALFIYLGASQEAAMAQLKDITVGLPVSEAMVTQVLSLPAHAKLDEAVEALLHTSQHEFPVLDEDGRVLGILTRDDMFAALKKSGLETPVADVMRRNLPCVRPTDPFDEAFRLMQESSCPVLPVVDHAGRLVGVITTENVGEMMFVRSILPPGAAPAWRASRTRP